MNRLPSRDTSHKGMLSRRPRPSMAVTISLGNVAAVETEPPMPLMTVATIPPHTLKMAVMISMQLPTATFARMKRMKCRKANSGRWKSRKLAALWKMPMAKNRTRRP